MVILVEEEVIFTLHQLTCLLLLAPFNLHTVKHVKQKGALSESPEAFKYVHVVSPNRA